MTKDLLDTSHWGYSLREKMAWVTHFTTVVESVVESQTVTHTSTHPSDL